MASLPEAEKKTTRTKGDKKEEEEDSEDVGYSE